MSTTRSPRAVAVPEYVLPKPPRGAPWLPADAAQRDVAVPAAGGIEALGDRLQDLLASQQQLLGELRATLQGLDAAVHEDTRARLKAQVHTALQVLDWSDAVQSDLQRVAMGASHGWQLVDLGAFCRDLAIAARCTNAVLVSGNPSRTWFGDACLLARVFVAALDLVSARTSGLGTIAVDVGATDREWTVHVAGSGEPGGAVDPEAVREFRQAIEELGARVSPDALGVGGAGLRIHLREPD
jgi:hypothetical protein